MLCWWVVGVLALLETAGFAGRPGDGDGAGRTGGARARRCATGRGTSPERVARSA